MNTPIYFHTYIEHDEKRKPNTDELYFESGCCFCNSEDRFFYFPKNTTWNCKKCASKGNIYQFLQAFYQKCCTKQDHLPWDLPARVTETIKWSPRTSCFVIPTFRNGRLNNLYKLAEDKTTGKLKALSTPGISPTLCNWPTGEHDEIWLTEGQKDRFAAEAMLGSKEIEAVGAPGSASFQKSWLSAFQDKKVCLIFDNDDSGEKGMDAITEMIAASPYKPKELYRVQWPTTKPKGYDLYDLWVDNGAQSFSLMQSYLDRVVQDNTTKITSDTVQADDTCDTFAKLMEVMESIYYVTADMRRVFAVILGSIYSTNLEGEQFWVKIIGRPGAGKSTLSKAVSASDFVELLSTFTGLFSGHKDQDESDNSLIPLIKNRTLVVKDADALLRQGNIEQIMSELRDFYDKDSAVRYRHGLHFNYQNIRSTFILMGTQALRRSDQSYLGERLLSIELDVSEKEEWEINNRALTNAENKALGKASKTEKDLMASTKGFIEHLKQRDTVGVEIPEKFKREMMGLATLVAKMRTQVDRDPRGKLLSPAVPELPTRLIGQLYIATVSLCTVYGVKSPTPEISEIIRKIARDTANPRSHRFLICDIIHETPGVTATQIQERTGLDKATLNGELHDLRDLGFIQLRDIMQDNGFKQIGITLDETIQLNLSKVLSDVN